MPNPPADLEAVVKALQTNLIVQLAQAGFDNHKIAKTVGVHVTRVIPIATALKKAQKKAERQAEKLAKKR